MFLKNLRVLVLAPMAASVVFTACQKDVMNGTPANEGQISQQNTRATGALPDDPNLVEKVPLIMSASFLSSEGRNSRKPGTGTTIADSDADGIADNVDGCPTQKETVNGYMDTDGCPDSVPVTVTDTDGDGIPDAQDGCPSQRETVNGYQDTDGCPDTLPDTDGDGIVDTQDGCPTQAETFNGYQDTDGCPDTVPVTLPPTPLPSSVQLAMPPVQNQGGEFSCAAFAVVYAARSAEQFYKTNASSYSNGTNIFSPEFVYNQAKAGADCGSGVGVTTALEFLKNTGVCTWQSMPYSYSNGCSLLPTGAQQAEAANYKINSYSRMVISDIIAIKSMVAGNHPVIITVTPDASFQLAGPGFIWKSFTSTPSASHAIVICGYDDAKHAYKVMNSWGTQWGEGGFSWIDYDFLPQPASYSCYAIN